jgi:hypothetical protein
LGNVDAATAQAALARKDHADAMAQEKEAKE